MKQDGKAAALLSLGVFAGLVLLARGFTGKAKARSFGPIVPQAFEAWGAELAANTEAQRRLQAWLEENIGHDQAEQLRLYLAESFLRSGCDVVINHFTPEQRASLFAAVPELHEFYLKCNPVPA